MVASQFCLAGKKRSDGIMFVSLDDNRPVVYAVHISFLHTTTCIRLHNDAPAQLPRG